MPCRLGFASTVERMRALISAAVSCGSWAATSATRPVTCGAAIEVPVLGPYPPPGFVLRMSVPGAATSTLCGPQFEPPLDGEAKSASSSFGSVAATEITLSRSKLAGQCGVTSSSQASFPAAATIKIPLSPRARTAS